MSLADEIIKGFIQATLEALVAALVTVGVIGWALYKLISYFI